MALFSGLTEDQRIPTGAANSRIAALRARRRPTIDVNEYGIGVEAGAGGVPMLSNRVEAFSDEALGGVEQRGFGSGRAAISEAMDAAGRTYRGRMNNEALERAREQRQMDYALEEEDALQKQKTSNAVAALKQRSDLELAPDKQRSDLALATDKAHTEAYQYFDPVLTRRRLAELEEKLGVLGAQTAGTEARAAADIYKADAVERAAANTALLKAQQQSLESLADIRAGLKPGTPAKESWLPFGWGDTPAQPNDQADIDTIDAQTMRLLRSLNLATPGDAPRTGTGGEPIPFEGDPVARRQYMIGMWAQKKGITPEQAEEIMLRRGLIGPPIE